MTFSDPSIINFASLENCELTEKPYPFVIVSDFLRAESADAVIRDFPKIDFPGSVPLTGLKYGSTFQKLIEELEGEVLRSLIEKKFEVDLKNKPVMITVRGRTRSKDGRIHTDTKSKLMTLLLYFNREWKDDGGRLRVLNGRDNLNDYVREIPPTFGTCFIFKVTHNCWHGHKPFEGERKAIQLNYLVNQAALTQHITKHRMSARMKSWKRWFSPGDDY